MTIWEFTAVLFLSMPFLVQLLIVLTFIILGIEWFDNKRKHRPVRMKRYVIYPNEHHHHSSR